MNAREYPKNPLVGVGGVIVKGQQVLLVRRAREPLRGQWSLPGGLVETGETLAAAVRREIAEETGLRVRVERIVEVLDRITRDSQKRVQFHYVLVDFLCRVQGGRLRAGSDVSEARWVRRDQLATYGLRAVTRRVIDIAFRKSVPRGAVFLSGRAR
jgi:ADP-ribose pyrophosphatase YjhB (NUDIX family)